MKKKMHDEEDNVNARIDEWKVKYLRALADYQNLEKRTRSEKDETRRFATEVCVLRLLPVMDTLERATKHVTDQGLILALKEFAAAFAEFGVTKIHTVGKQFNPHEMECIEVVQGEENVVIEEVLPGYRLHDKVLRVAQVKVGRKMIKAT